MYVHIWCKSVFSFGEDIFVWGAFHYAVLANYFCDTTKLHYNDTLWAFGVASRRQCCALLLPKTLFVSGLFLSSSRWVQLHWTEAFAPISFFLLFLQVGGVTSLHKHKHAVKPLNSMLVWFCESSTCIQLCEQVGKICFLLCCMRPRMVFVIVTCTFHFRFMFFL